MVRFCRCYLKDVSALLRFPRGLVVGTPARTGGEVPREVRTSPGDIFIFRMCVRAIYSLGKMGSYTLFHFNVQEGCFYIVLFVPKGRCPMCFPSIFRVVAEVIPWWINALARHVPRSITFRNSKATVIYTDACGSGHIGAVLFFRGCQYVYHCHLPKWLAESAGIYEFELAGLLFGIMCAIELEHGAPLLVFCDNMGAIGTVVRASSKTVIGRALCSVIWVLPRPQGPRYGWNTFRQGST